MNEHLKKFKINKYSLKSNLSIINSNTKIIFTILNKYERFKKYLIDFITDYILELAISNSDADANELFLGKNIKDLNKIKSEYKLQSFSLINKINEDIEIETVYKDLFVKQFNMEEIDWINFIQNLNNIFDNYLSEGIYLNSIILAEANTEFEILHIYNFGTIYEYRIKELTN